MAYPIEKKLWRPPEWDDKFYGQCSDFQDGVEAGANAILRAFIKEIEQLEKRQCHTWSLEKFIQSNYWKKLKEGK